MNVLKIATSAAVLALLATPAPVFAQSNEEKKAKKLAEAWIKSPEWTTDYDKALEKAKASGKAIFGYFTRSYSY